MSSSSKCPVASWRPGNLALAAALAFQLAVLGAHCQLAQQHYSKPASSPRSGWLPFTLARSQQPATNLDGPGGRTVVVPGSAPLVRHASRVDQVIYPYESYAATSAATSSGSYVIDHKRFVESYSSRCMASTLVEDPDAVEPNFVVVRPRSEVRVNATEPVESIVRSGFDARQPTTILVHGFTQSYPETEWLRKARGLFEMHQLVGRQNLVIMDWGVGAQGSYTQVAARASAMGSFLANFLMKLFELGADRKSVHLVGHSLGAHVAGFAGKRIRPRVGRITGLDAAGPCFGKLFSNSPNDRLAPDDALEVAVYHYDDDFLGLPGQIGQFDVYVNGGASQPGAVDNINSMAQALVTMVFRRNRPLSESHTRSTEVATSQLSRSGCQMVAYECRDWPAFLSGECGLCDDANGQCFSMAFDFQYNSSYAHDQQLQTSQPPLRQAPPPGKRLFIVTSPKELFCLQHFQVVVQFELSPDLVNLARKQKWRVHLELINERQERSNLTVSNLVAPNVFTHLLLSEMQPARFRQALLQLRQHDNKPVAMRDQRHQTPDKTPPRPYSQPVRLSSLEVNFMSHIEPLQRRRLSSRLCPSGWVEEQNSIQDSSSNSDWLALDEC